MLSQSSTISRRLCGTDRKKRRAENGQFADKGICRRHQPRYRSAPWTIDRAGDVLDAEVRAFDQETQFASGSEFRLVPYRGETKPTANAPGGCPQAPFPQIADDESAARLQHAGDLSKRKFGFRHECQHRDNANDVETVLSKRQVLCPASR